MKREIIISFDAMRQDVCPWTSFQHNEPLFNQIQNYFAMSKKALPAIRRMKF
jgi:hypothetical protein